MKTIDLTHPLTPDMPVYPGDESPGFSLQSEKSTHGYQVSRISMDTHTGTHMDTAAHLLPEDRFIHDYPLSDFIGKGKVIDCSDQKDIEKSWLQKNLESPMPEFILIHTNCSRYWGEKSYFQSFPVLTKEAAGWLARLPLKGIGVDTPSFDETSSTSYDIHLQFLNKGIILIENLCNLDSLAGLEFTFFCVPLPLQVSDGSPVRAFALTDE